LLFSLFGWLFLYFILLIYSFGFAMFVALLAGLGFFEDKK
jgi:hypothetical protein